jgi:DNA-binding transcriptional MerR regulator
MTETAAERPSYGIGALARRLGIAPATLRDWELRYGMGPSARTVGGHRRYQPADIVRIDLMRRLILDGVPPAEAAQAALTARPQAPVQPGPAQPNRADDTPAGRTAAVPGGPPGRGAGGRSLSLPGQLPQARGLARAALALDGPAITRTLDRSLQERGVVVTWERLAVPVLTALGQRNAATGASVEIEHLLSAQLLAALVTRASRFPAPQNSRAVLLACADGEMHSLALYALAAALAERRVGTRMLGARTPPAALADAIARTGPAAAVVWSQTAETGDPGQLPAIPRQRPALRLLIAGPGWLSTPAGARHVTSLPDAVQQAGEAVGTI